MRVRSSRLGSLAISAISVSNSPTAVPVLNSMNTTIIVQLNLEIALGLGQALNSRIIFSSRIGGVERQNTAVHLAVQLRSQTADSRGQRLNFEELHLDTVSHTVRVSEIPVHLTKTEYAILKLLMQNPGQVITKSLLLDKISWDTPDCMESSLKVHISNLRRNLRAVHGKDYIEAVWGIGFKLREN